MKTFQKFSLISAILFASAAQAQYCMLPGRTPYSGEQPGIKVFKLNTINRVSSNVESFSSVVVVTNDTTTLLRGHTYSVTMYHSRDSIIFPTTRNNIRVWLDYNGNGNFDDAGETVISSDFQNMGFYTSTFTVPATAPVGYTRLRATAKMSSDAGHAIPTSCDVPADPIGYHGEMEDYVVKIMATTGIDDTRKNNSIVVYPNPTVNQVTISFDGTSNDPISIDVFDMAGKLINKLVSNQVKSAADYTFDLNSFVPDPGMYIIRVSTSAGSSYHKIIKSN